MKGKPSAGKLVIFTIMILASIIIVAATPNVFYVVLAEPMFVGSKLASQDQIKITVVNYTLSINATAGGTTDPAPGNYSYPEGTNVTVTAIQGLYYRFARWELDYMDAGSNNPMFVIMDSNHTLKAYFAPLDYLYVTVATDKPLYGLSENMSITGNLTSSDLAIDNGLVAVEVRDSANIPFTFRTRPTGPEPKSNWPINFTQLYPCDSNGISKYIFQQLTNLLVFFTVTNHGVIDRHVLVAISVYDHNNVPFVTRIPYSAYLEAGRSTTVIFSPDPIPLWTALGTATIYANVYSDLPKTGGYPYSPEQVATFTITSFGGYSSMEAQTYDTTSTILQTTGTYDLSLRIPPEARVGNYSVFVGSYYCGLQDVDNTEFQMVLIGDINNDGFVELADFFFMSQAFGSNPGHPRWDPRCDIAPWPDGDDFVELQDFFMLSLHFGEHVPQP